jgi:hypothetical protein
MKVSAGFGSTPVAQLWCVNKPLMTAQYQHAVKRRLQRLRRVRGTWHDCFSYLYTSFGGARRSTLVCESVAEAKRLAFASAERHKVVALDGTLIAKAGFITGGLSGTEAARAQRWDDKELAALKEARAHACMHALRCACMRRIAWAWMQGKISLAARPCQGRSLPVGPVAGQNSHAYLVFIAYICCVHADIRPSQAVLMMAMARFCAGARAACGGAGGAAERARGGAGGAGAGGSSCRAGARGAAQGRRAAG